MRYTKEVRLRLSGDEQRATAFIPLARKEVGIMRSTSGEDIKQNVRRVTPADGVTITIREGYDQITCSIHAEPQAQPVVAQPEAAALVPEAVSLCPTFPDVDRGMFFTDMLGITSSDMLTPAKSAYGLTEYIDIGFDFNLYGVTTSMWSFGVTGEVRPLYPGSFQSSAYDWSIEAPQNLIDLAHLSAYGWESFFDGGKYFVTNYPSEFNDNPNCPVGYLYNPYYTWSGPGDFYYDDWIFWAIEWEIERNLQAPKIRPYGTKGYSSTLTPRYYLGKYNGRKFAAFTFYNFKAEYPPLYANFQVVLMEGGENCPNWIGIFYKNVDFTCGTFDWYRLNQALNYSGFANMPANVCIMDYGNISKCHHTESNTGTIYTGVAQQSYWFYVDKGNGAVDLQSLPQGWVASTQGVIKYLGVAPPVGGWPYDEWKDTYSLI